MARLIPHVSPFICPLQSAYRQFHSTETVLVKIASDLFEAAESGCVTVLVALDLTQDLDTIDHLVFVRRLEHTFGVEGPAFSWAKSYLKRRSCFEKVGNAMSTTLGSYTAVPQGSVLGPLLFSLYVTPLGDVISSFGVKLHQSADDMQINLAANKDSLSKATLDLAGCTDTVYDGYSTTLWLSTKTSQKWLCSVLPRVGKQKQSASVAVAGVQIVLTDHVKSLGMTFDSHLSFDKHINNICRACYFHIRGLRHVRYAMSTDTAKFVACAIVSSQLDYCNALPAGMLESNLDKLNVSKTPSFASSLDYVDGTTLHRPSRSCTGYRSEPE